MYSCFPASAGMPQRDKRGMAGVSGEKHHGMPGILPSGMAGKARLSGLPKPGNVCFPAWRV
jgi:hypothetical protein